MAIKTSKSNESYFARYKQSNLYASNRRRKLQKQLKLQPGNAEQINTALANITWRRKKPTVAKWSHSAINDIILSKLFAKGPAIPKSPKIDEPKAKYREFSLAARAHNRGVLVWS